MKKFLAIALALCMVFALAACGQTAAPAASEAPAESAAPEAKEPIKLTVWVGDNYPAVTEKMIESQSIGAKARKAMLATPSVEAV